MSKKTHRGLTRREFARITGAGALATGVGANFLFPARAAAQQKTLKIVQWSHFVPGYDKWFDNTYTKEWGEKNKTNVVVDHIAIGEINARAAAEVAAKKGHDLFMFLSPPAAYEKQVIDHREIYEACREEARQEDRPGAQVHLQPEDEEVLRLLRLLRPGSRATTARTSGRRSGSPTGRTPGRTCASAARRSRTSSAIPSGSGSRRSSTRTWRCGPCSGPSGPATRTTNGNVAISSKNTLEAIKYVRALLQGVHDPGGLHLGPVVEQPGHPRREALLRLQRDLGDALGGEGQPRDVEGDHGGPGAEGARSAGSRPST